MRAVTRVRSRGRKMTTTTSADPIVTQAEARFWAKTDVRGPDECWPWMGAQASTGYGRYSVGRKPRPAHQVAWELRNGKPFPAGKVGCHECDNPKCVNPAHIWPGTQGDNIRDCVAKGRHASKPQAQCAKGHALTPDNRRPAAQQSRCIICDREATRDRTRRYRERRSNRHA
jgi:hypothetical protein